MTAKRPYDHGSWRRIRQAILNRDNHRCKIRYQGCLDVATHVDHIIPWEDGGAWLDGTNLQAACAKCNVAKANKGRTEQWRKGPPITLVYGPPEADKTGYVAGLEQPGDLVVDYDRIAKAIGTNHEAVNAARNALLTKVRRNETGATRVFIISANPNAPAMFPHHELVSMGTETVEDAQGYSDATW